MTFLDTDIFAKIVAGEIPCNKVYETPNILAFYDINPQAEKHIVIITKENLVTAQEVTPENTQTFGELFLAAKEIAKELNLPGYKLAMNVGEEGGQVVPHVHLHMLSPEFKWSL